jgi:type II secretory pathway component PulM
MRHLVRSLGILAWTMAVLAIGLGVMGVSAAVNPVPDESSRPELYARAERAFAPALATLVADMDALDVPVESLAAQARAALVDLAAQDAGALDKDLAAGDLLVVQIQARSLAAQAALDPLPYDAHRDLLAQATLQRIAAAHDAVAAVAPLAGLWSQLSASILPSRQLVADLVDHDKSTFTAVVQGGAGDYAAALTALDTSTLKLDDAQAIRDRIAKLVDTTTIDQWIARNRAYDTALQRLYEDVRASNGSPTPALRAEVAAVETARQQLPPDTRALIVIIGDLAQGGLNSAAIALEQARGALADAVAAVH